MCVGITDQSVLKELHFTHILLSIVVILYLLVSGIILEGDRKVLLTDFEVGGLQRGAGEQPGEDHVDGNGEAVADVTLGYLDVLDLRGVSGVTFSTS